MAALLMLGAPSAFGQQPGSSWQAAPPANPASTRVVAKPVTTMSLQPVARFGEETPPPSQATPSSRPGWQLRWRKPSQASSGVVPASAPAVSAEHDQIMQAAFQAPGDQADPLALPDSLELPQDDADDPTNSEIFQNPFDNLPATPDAPMAEPEDQPSPGEAADAPQELPSPASPSDAGPVPDNPMRAEPQPLQEEEKYRTNPFSQRDQEEDDEAGLSDRYRGLGDERGAAVGSRQLYNCDDIRTALRERTIDKVSLDISPPFRPDVIDEVLYERARNDFEERQSIRQWRSNDGVVMATGRLQDLAYEKVVIDSEHGGIEELPIDRVSEADLAYISENWGLPQECRIEQVAYEPRQWMPAKVTWKASSLCHKPLYFEEVNLERYGHTAGPFAQPLISSAHFFFNIAVLPYKAGIHPPTECQYALGYYRPGSCAPWILPPVPLSLRGAVTQATVVASGIGFIP